MTQPEEMMLTDEDLDAIDADHTPYGEPCEKCKHRFPYDSCVACGEDWPCSASVLVAEVRASRTPPGDNDG